MAFCTKCGKPLAEGEVCSCQQTPVQTQGAAPQQPVTPPVMQQAAPQGTPAMQPAQPNAVGEFFKELWVLILGMLKTPVATISNYVGKAEVKYAFVLIGVNAVVAALVRLFGILKMKSASSISDLSYSDISDIFNMAMGSSAKSSSSYTAGFVVKNMLFSLLFVIVAAVVVAAVILLFANVLAKVKVSFTQALCIASLTAVFVAPASLIAFIFGLFNMGFFTELGSCVSAFAAAAGAVFVFFGIRAVCRNEDKIPYIAGLASAISGFAVYIVGLLN